MNLEDVVRLSEVATDRFRLETLPEYLVAQEVDELVAWRRGERRLDTPETLPWLGKVRDDVAKGQRWWRVHILDYPLAEYSRWELFAYQANVAAGEHILVADRAWHDDLNGLREDFWLYDASIVVRMVYDEEGGFLRPEARAEVQPYLRLRNLAVKHSVPLIDYLRKYEPDLIAEPLR